LKVSLSFFVLFLFSFFSLVCFWVISCLLCVTVEKEISTTVDRNSAKSVSRTFYNASLISQYTLLRTPFKWSSYFFLFFTLHFFIQNETIRNLEMTLLICIIENVKKPI
jgi:hypothetical protein